MIKKINKEPDKRGPDKRGAEDEDEIDMEDLQCLAGNKRY